MHSSAEVADRLARRSVTSVATTWPVTDGDPAGWVVEFKGALAKTDVPAMAGDVRKETSSRPCVVTGGAVGDKLVLDS